MSQAATRLPHVEKSMFKDNQRTPDLGDTVNARAASLSERIRARVSDRLRGPRVMLLAGGVIVVLLGASYFYLTAGRYVSTDNAYVKATKVMIAAEVAGMIADVDVKENQRVAKDDVLFRLDDRAYRLTLKQLDARLRTIYDEIDSLKASYRQKTAELDLARENLAFARLEFDRQARLAATDTVSRAKFDMSRHDVDVANKRIRVAEQELAQIRAQLNDNPDIDTEQHSRYADAAAARDKAALDLAHTVIRAPFAGIASNVPTVGQQVTGNGALSSPIMSVVRDSGMWIEANFKETDIGRLQPGQKVEIDVDTYSDRSLSGEVASISQATGAEFAVIPPQNATGNWVKVVQRVPIRIAVDNAKGVMLRSGMSTNVIIDTGRYPNLPAFLQSASREPRQDDRDQKATASLP